MILHAWKQQTPYEGTDCADPSRAGTVVCALNISASLKSPVKPKTYAAVIQASIPLTIHANSSYMNQPMMMHSVPGVVIAITLSHNIVCVQSDNESTLFPPSGIPLSLTLQKQ